MNTENNEEYQELNVAEGWMQIIFSKVMKLEQLERDCRHGVREVNEMFTTSPNDRITFQFESLKMMITEQRLFLGNVEIIINEKLVKTKFIPPLDFFQQAVTETPKKFIELQTSIKQKKTLNLSGGFWFAVNKLSKMRERIVVELAKEGYVLPKKDEEENE